MDSKLLALPLFAAAGAAGFLFFRQVAITPNSSFSPTPIPTVTLAPSQQVVSLNIIYSPSKISHYSQNYIASQSALALLESVATQSGVQLGLKKFSFGTLVESIGDSKNSLESAWIFFVNGQSASSSADSYLLHPGDRIEFKYVKPQ